MQTLLDLGDGQDYAIKNEEELFNYLKKYFITDLMHYEDQYSFTDCFSNEKRLEIELKVRHTHYDNMIIEQLKYKGVIGRALNFNRHPLYICSSPKDVYGWDLTDITIDWVDKDNLPTTTEFENKDKTVKKVGFLPVESAFKYNLGGKTKL